MATRNTRKSLKASTAIVAPKDNVVPISKSNKPAVLDDRIIRQYALQAFSESDEGVKLQGKATQRLAAAVIAQWTAWDVNGHPDENVGKVAPLEHSNRSKDVRNALTPLFRKVFIDAIPEGMAADDKASAEAKRTAHNALLVSAIKLACIIVMHNMTLASFNPATGNFSIPKSLMLAKGEAWTGLMAVNTAPIPLDGRSYSAERQGKTGTGSTPFRVSFSVRSLFAAINPRKPATKPAATAGKQESNADWSAIKLDNAPQSMLLRALHKQLIKTEGDPAEAGKPNSAAFTAEEWSMLSDLAQWSDAEQSKPGFVKDALDKARASK